MVEVGRPAASRVTPQDARVPAALVELIADRFPAAS